MNGFDIGVNITGARLSYGNIAGGRPVDLTLDDLTLMIPGGKKMSVTTHGTLLNHPYVAEFTGGTLQELLQQKEWPVDLSATGSGATLGITGSISGARGDTQARLNLLGPWPAGDFRRYRTSAVSPGTGGKNPAQW